MPATASPTITAAEVLEDLAMEISIARTEGSLHYATRLLHLINVASDLADLAAKDSCADEPLARTLRREAKALGDLSDRLCSAINDHGDRRHPRVQIISEIKSAVGELAEA